MKTLFGVGPITIQKQISGGELLSCQFDYFIQNDIDIDLDIRNSNDISFTGEDLSFIKGMWIEFKLTLTDPEIVGEDGENINTFRKIVNAVVAESYGNQTFDIIPHKSAQTGRVFVCKFASNKISIRDLNQKGYGQSVSFTIRTKERLTQIPNEFYDSNFAQGIFIDNEMRDLG